MKNTPSPFAPKYIDPMSDFGFKKIFKDSGRKELLIRPLNAIFGLDIADLEIGESERQGDTPEDRSACFDLYCTSSDGKRFIVEVQKLRQRHFLKRAIYYTTFPIAGAAPKGRHDGGGWDFDFPPTFFLELLDFDFDFRRTDGQRAADPEHFIHRFSLRDDDTGEPMTDSLRFAFLEIRRFDKRRGECRAFEDKFLYLMKNLPIFAEAPALWEEEEPYFRAMLDEAEFAQMSREQKQKYREEMRRDWDYKNTMDYAIAEGHAEGHAKGLAEGLAEGHAQGKEEGLAEGLAKGKAEGLAEGQQAVARRMLAKGFPEEIIVELTELTENQVRELVAAD